MPFPGRRARKVERWTLASALVTLTVLGSFSSLLPGITATIFPTIPSIVPDNGPAEVPRVSLPAGTVSYGVTSSPFYSKAADSSVSPTVLRTPEGLVYDTSYGQYSFRSSNPYVFTLRSRSGTQFTRGSWFFVNTTVAATLSPGTSIVTASTNSHFDVSYSVLSGNVTVGMMELTVDFYQNARPKFTAVFTEIAPWNLGGFNVVWSTISDYQWYNAAPISETVQTNTSTSHPVAATQPVRNSTSTPISSTAVRLGRSSDASSWGDSLTIDWSDAPGGVLQTGPTNLGNSSGAGVRVTFPSNQSTIDPTQVGTSTVDYSTAYSTQHKNFHYGDYYFNFWYDGHNIVYSTSPNGAIWSTPVSTSSGQLNYGFDVYNQGSTIAMTWLDYSSSVSDDGVQHLWFQEGNVIGNSVAWSQNGTIATLPQHKAWPPSVAIGTDGVIWVGGVWPDSGGSNHIWISCSCNGQSFTPSINYTTSNVNSRFEALQLVPLQRGRMMALSSHYYDTSIRWRVYNPVTSSGSAWSAIQTFNAGLPANTNKTSLISAVGTLDGFVHLITTPGSTYWAYNDTAGQWSTGTQLDSSAGDIYPTLSYDGLGNLYYLHLDTSFGSIWYRMKPSGQLWSGTEGIFGAGNWLSASPIASKQLVLSWTSSSSPYQIYVGTIPLASGVASAAPSMPWSKLGVNNQLSSAEYVNPGNGLLGVGYTDLSVPGRDGLDLSIRRIYLQPFTFLGAPFNYEFSPYANLGAGWQLNLPWVSAQYLHYSDGQLFPLNWKTYNATTSGTHVIKTWSFEYHGSMDFVLLRTNDTNTSTGITVSSYKLTSRDGSVYGFNGVGLVTSLVDRTGQNQLTFTQGNYQGSLQNTLSSITDSVGRNATFTYGCQNCNLQTATYGGQTISYAYSGINLVSVTDQLGRTLKYGYVAQNQWLIANITYPTGGYSTYTYGSATIGTDALNYYVTLQNVYTTSLQRTTSFSYQITDGSVNYANVTQSDGVHVQGYTVNEFGIRPISETTSWYGPNRLQLKKTVSWWDSSGRPDQQDVYMSGSPIPSYSTKNFYDSWGNMIYNQDALGHSSYSSYANTNTQYEYYGPGSTSQTTNGKTFYDDFNTQFVQSANWLQGGNMPGATQTSAFSVLNITGASSNPGTGPGSWQTSYARTAPTILPTFNYPITLEVQMSLSAKAGANNLASARLVISPQSNPAPDLCYYSQDALCLALNYDTRPYYDVVQYSGGLQSFPYNSGYVTGGSLSVTWKLVLTDRNTLTIYLNKGSGWERVVSTTSAGLSGIFAPAFMYLELSTQNATPSSATFDYLGVYNSNFVTVNGLKQGQNVSLIDWNNITQATGTVPTGQTSLTLNATTMIFPYGSLITTEQDGRSNQFISPTREIWGGSVYAYTLPFRSSGLSRTTTGFLHSSTVYVEDVVPPGSTLGQNNDTWLWDSASHIPVVSGLESHTSLPFAGFHDHYFMGSTSTISPASGSFLIQYVYLPSTSVPSEVMINFHDTSGSWEHRAYWGSNSINMGVNGTASRWYMGPLPSPRDSWIMLVVKADDVGLNGLTVDGWTYALFNGGAYWDYSALGNSSMGTITVTNLRPGESVSIYSSTATLVASGYVLPGGSNVTLNLYAAGINQFPFSAYIKVYTETGSLEYSSPLMTDIWGGDVYLYNQPTDHYPTLFQPFFFTSVNPAIRNAQIGTATYQNSGSAIESYSKYDTLGNLLQAKQRYDSGSGTQWITTSATYDSYGNAKTNVDALGNTVYNGYSSAYQSAYLTNQTRRDGQTQFTSLSGYNFTNGVRLWIFDPRGYNTTYRYDILGRLKTLTYPSGLGSVNYAYGDSGNYVNTTNPNGWKTRQIYDRLGRQSIVEKFLGSVPYSNLTTTYNWQNKVSSQIDQTGNSTTYQYDYLGRLVTTTKPDGTSVYENYTFVNPWVTTKDENSNYRCYMSDWLGHLVQLNEYSDRNCSMSTTWQGYTYIPLYSYDWNGNLVSLTNSANAVTTYTYDNLNRLTSTSYPDHTSESRTYDANGNVLTRVDKAGVKTLYSYDALNRIKTITYCGSPITSTNYTYDGNSNVLTIQNENTTLTYTYDGRNRILTERYQVNPSTRTVTDLGCSGSGGSWTVQGGTSADYTVTYTYSGDVVSTITYPTVGSPTNIGVGYVYDSLGRVLTLNQTGSSNHFADFTYLKTDEISQLQFGNGLTGSYTYDKLQRTTSISLKSGSTYLISLTYVYNNTGTVAGVTGQVNNSNVNEQYSYDPFRRLTTSSVASQGGTDTVSYQYDNLGNRISQTNNTVLTNYSVSTANNELTSLSVPSTGANTAYSYDMVGNLKTMNVTSGSTNRWTYSWSAAGRLMSVNKNSVQQGSYVYDGQARQTESIESGSNKIFYAYYGADSLFKYVAGGSPYSIDFLYAGGLRIASMDSSTGHFNTVQYFHTDALGSTRLITSSHGNINFANGYQPYGRDNGAPTGSSVEKFTGKPVSQTTGLYYELHRWYDPTIGRFISSDPKQGKLSNPQSFNLYIYVIDRPTSLTDPSGLDWWNPFTWSQQQQAQAFTIAVIAVAIVAVVATGGIASPLAAAAVGAALSSGTYTLAAGDKATLAGAVTYAAVGAVLGGAGAAIGGGSAVASTGMNLVERAAVNGAIGAGFNMGAYSLTQAATGKSITLSGLMGAAGNGFVGGALGTRGVAVPGAGSGLSSWVIGNLAAGEGGYVAGQAIQGKAPTAGGLLDNGAFSIIGGAASDLTASEYRGAVFSGAVNTAEPFYSIMAGFGNVGSWDEFGSLF